MKRGFWRSIWYVLTLTCDESSRLLSDSLDRDLTRVEHVALRLHDATCKSCKRFFKQLEFMRRAAPKAVAEGGGQSLSPEAKEQIRESLRRASGHKE